MTINHIIPGLVAVGIALVAGCATTPDDSKRSEAIYNAPEPVLGSSLLRRERRTEGVTEVKGDAAIVRVHRVPPTSPATDIATTALHANYVL